MWRNFIKNIDLLTNYDTFVINDWKFFAKKKFFSYKHMSMFFLAVFSFIFFYNFILVNYFCQYHCQKNIYQC